MLGLLKNIAGLHSNALAMTLGNTTVIIPILIYTFHLPLPVKLLEGRLIELISDSTLKDSGDIMYG